MSFVSVRLNSNTSRLNFLFRFLSETEDRESNLPYYSDFIHSFTKHDYVLLSDGWGDLLFVLHDCVGCSHPNLTGNILGHKEQKSRLEEIFDIQNFLYQDFQVDRTEMFFTPMAVDLSLKQADKFRITINARVREERLLNHINDVFVQAFNEKISVAFAGRVKCTIFKIAGSMDFEIRFDKIDIPIGHQQSEFIGSFYNKLLDCFQGLKVDRVITNIQHFWYDSTSQKNESPS